MSRIPPLESEFSESTSASLIRRVRQRESDAWVRLTELYAPLVYSWARRGGLRESDAADAVQEVFRSVWQGIDQFQRHGSGGSFRAWLWTITRNRVHLFFRQQAGRPLASGGSEAALRLAQLPAWDERDEDSSVQESRRLLHRALEVVRGDFQETTWQAFWQTTMLDRSAAETAAELGLTENAVRQAKFRVLRRLRQELDDRLA